MVEIYKDNHKQPPLKYRTHYATTLKALKWQSLIPKTCISQNVCHQKAAAVICKSMVIKKFSGWVGSSCFVTFHDWLFRDCTKRVLFRYFSWLAFPWLHKTCLVSLLFMIGFSVIARNVSCFVTFHGWLFQEMASKAHDSTFLGAGAPILLTCKL